MGAETMEKCHLCGNDTEKVINKPYKYDECGLNVILFGIIQYHCPNCNESYASIPNIRKLHRFIGIHICKNRKALLKSEEIKFLRKDIHLKAKEFAQALGVTPSAVSQWENGKNEIDEAYDRLLRSIYITYASEQSDHFICHGVINLFKELPAKRKKIKQPKEIVLTPREWLNHPDEPCFA